MKISSLAFSGYRNLHDVSLDFGKSNGVVAVAGRNGSGKSNFLEAVVSVLARIKGNSQLSAVPDAYDMRATLESLACKYCLKDGNVSNLVEGSPVASEPPLPKQVVAVYSGNASRLREMMQRAGRDFLYLDYHVVQAALLLLFASQRKNVEDFVRESLHYQSGLRVRFRLSMKRYRSSRVDVVAQSFWQTFVPQNGNVLTMTTEDLRKMLDAAGSERELFEFVRNALCNGNDGFIRQITIEYKAEFGQKIESRQLSEGELKLAFFLALYEFVAEDDSVVLLDEPDTHVHESRKIELLELFRGYVKYGRQTIFTTHSPGLINGIDGGSLVSLLPDDKGTRAIVGVQDEQLMRTLAGARMSLYTNRPFVLFEGRSDIDYLMKAVRVLKRRLPAKYAQLPDDLGCELLPYGGTGNAAFFYDRLRRAFPDRKIVVFCDRDSGGITAMRLMDKYFGLGLLVGDVKLGSFTPTILEKFKSYGVCFIRLPDAKNGEGCVEDYLSRDFIGDLVANYYLQKSDFKSFSTLSVAPEKVKRDLMQGVVQIPDEEMMRFEPLVEDVSDMVKSANALMMGGAVCGRRVLADEAVDLLDLSLAEEDLRKKFYTSSSAFFGVAIGTSSAADWIKLQNELGGETEDVVVAMPSVERRVYDTVVASDLLALVDLAQAAERGAALFVRSRVLKDALDLYVEDAAVAKGFRNARAGEHPLFSFALFTHAQRIVVCPSTHLKAGAGTKKRLPVQTVLSYWDAIFGRLVSNPSYGIIWNELWHRLDDSLSAEGLYDVMGEEERSVLRKMWRKFKALDACHGLSQKFNKAVADKGVRGE